MKLCIRKTNTYDLDDIYNLHIKCFSPFDRWYKYIIIQYLNNGYVIENINDKQIIGLLLQGRITPCNLPLFNNIDIQDIFIPVNETGKLFKQNNNHLKQYNSIDMICIDPKYQNKGLASKLINKYIQENQNELLCLLTRESNIIAKKLYDKMKYEFIGIIHNKYINPNENAHFYIMNKHYL